MCVSNALYASILYTVNLYSLLLLQQEGAQLLLDKLSLVEGLSPVRPQGAMYIMVGIEVSKFKDIADDLEFITKLLAEKSVFVLPGQVSFVHTEFTSSSSKCSIAKTF